MTELEILKRRVEILEKGFQEIIAVLEKFAGFPLKDCGNDGKSKERVEEI